MNLRKMNFLLGILSLCLVNRAAADNDVLLAAAQHQLEPALLMAIVQVESKGDANAINRRTWDYGLMQINHRTAAAYGYLPVEMLNKRKNLQVASKLLRKLKNRYAAHEPGWACRYNVGTAKRVSHWNSCIVYLEKLCKAGYCVHTRNVASEPQRE